MIKMHIWTLDKWRKIYDLSDPKHRSGMRLRFDKNVDPEVKRACKEFAAWLSKQYFFPIRVPVYIKFGEKIRANDGEMASATCLIPESKQMEPYIRIATGDYYTLREDVGQDNALAAILSSMTHELTHYFQWVNDLKLTDIGCEKQARKYVDYILDDYAQTREHP